jgi:hypothetical protein
MFAGRWLRQRECLQHDRLSQYCYLLVVVFAVAAAVAAAADVLTPVPSFAGVTAIHSSKGYA